MANDVMALLERLDQIEKKHVGPLADILSVGVDLTLANIDKPYFALPKAWHDQLTTRLFYVWKESSEASSEIVNERFIGKSLYDASLKTSISDFAELFGAGRAVLISNATSSIVIDKVRRGLARGQSREELLRQIAIESPQVSAARAQLIVATESHSSSQYSSQRVAEASGRLLVKIWNSVGDDRTRRFGLLGRQSQFNHLVMNGQRRPLFDTFSIPTRLGGFEQLQYPGDPNGSPGNVINCRCVQTYEEAI